ncbi:MAG: ATP synthase F1 subunit delta [Flavobacteriaceae bacterium]
MSGTRAAIRYAKAILSVAEDNNTSAKIHEEMNHIANAIASNPELNEVLKSPVVKLSEKTTILEKVFAKTGGEIKSLFKTLAHNKRVDLLEQIALQYNRLYNELNNKEQATVTTAVPMTEALEKKVMAKLKTLSSKEVSLTKIVDETILGGFILRVGDQQYNASVSNQLNKIKSKFITN